MAKSHTSSGSDPDAVNAAIEVEDSSEEEIVSISNKSPTLPSSIERSPAPPSPPKFWVDPPPLPQDHESYTLIRPPPLKRPENGHISESEDETSRVPLELVGEINHEGVDYYYAKVEAGIVTRFTKRSVEAKYSRLVRQYKRKLENGTLSDFDPSSTVVHPKYRLPKLTLKLRPKRVNPSRSSRSSTVSYLSEEEALMVSSDSGDSDAVPVRQSARLAGNAGGNKPPKRGTRDLRRNNRAGSSGFSDSDGQDDGSEWSVVSGSDDSGKKQIPPLRIKRARHPRPTIQGLGIVRSIEEEDDLEESETAVLRRHRAYCEACGQQPAHKLLANFKRRKGKKPARGRPKKDTDDEESQPEEDRIEGMGGWIRCLHCCVAGHWGCLSGAQRHEIQMAAKKHENEVEKADRRAQGFEVGDDEDLVDKRKQIWLDETTEFVCGLCSRGGRCIICREETTSHLRAPVIPANGGTTAHDAIDLSTPSPEPSVVVQAATPAPKGGAAPSPPKSGPQRLESVKPNEVHSHYAPIDTPQVLFRCRTCRRPAHWQHLPPRDPKDKDQSTAVQIAEVYVERGPDQWKCPDCVRLQYPAESILAWRPDHPNAVETLARGEVPKPKDILPREYLVKFKERGYKRVEWVSHMWLVAMHEGLLRHFLKNGTKLPLLEDESEEYLEKIGKVRQDDRGKGKDSPSSGTLAVLPGFARSRSASAEVDKIEQPEYEETPGPMPDAQLRIPNSWLRIDRVLDAVLRLPTDKSKAKAKGKSKKKPIRIIESDESEEDADELDSDSDSSSPFVDGEAPPRDLTETVQDYELRRGEKVTAEILMSRAVWVYYKFEDLQYDECVWDSPPKHGSLQWDSYVRAIERYVFAQSVEVLGLSKTEEQQRDNRPKRDLSFWANKDLQPKLDDESLKLMPFQVQGLQWLYGNWWNLQPSILADDMGLGKTVQLVSLVGRLVTENVYPHLIVVPNSTIVNWVREFERWTPHVRVVRYNGEAKARQVIKQTELWNADGRQMYHALVTTYETLSGADFHQVFKKPGRWETVVVDEGQRLKSDSSLLFRKLNELKTIHRILMTGTPLNNNIRELFNLMNFLDPKSWNNLDQLEKEYDQENLTEELVARLHERLRPYFLRRQKAEVLDLPDKHEVIVPVSLAPIQKDIMRAILEANLQTLGLFADKNVRETRKGPAPKKSALHNALMEMRKCIQHPYLNSADMERRGLSQEETLKQLVDASAKFRLLKIMLPHLKKRGHRVLLFSQFKIVLDIVEDFLVMEGYKLLRLDGDTKSSLRQKEIDEYNKPGSDYFIYILTTRAGGVGVNLWSADTVIVFDPDFNPHQDLQAIARAHRYGQKKRVLVFKFMAKDTPEEKIFMMGKKKLVLDHLIVQKLGDEDEMEDIQGILMYGAKALFANPGESASDIKYTEKDIEELIIRAETEKVDEKKSTESGMKFDFAQVWDRGQGTKLDIAEDNQDTSADDDFWAGVIKRAAEEKEKKRAQELTGRGARKRAIANYNEADFLDESPEKMPKAQAGKGDLNRDDEFRPVGEESSSSDSEVDGLSGSDEPGSHMPSGVNDFSSNLNTFALAPHGPPPGGTQIPSLPSGAATGPSLQPTSLVNPNLPKAKKPRKPKPHLPPSLGVPFASGPSGAAELPGSSPLPVVLGFEYLCPYCHQRHTSGGCRKSSDIDSLLSYRQAILSPDNEDTDDHKFWALGHIDKKLLAHNFDLSQLVRPALNLAPAPKPPKSKPSKKPRPLPQDVAMTVKANVAGPSTSAAAKHKGLVITGIAGNEQEVRLEKPKPRKKPKPSVATIGQDPPGTSAGPSTSAGFANVSTAPSASSSAFVGFSAPITPSQVAPRKSSSGLTILERGPAPPPFAKPSATVKNAVPRAATASSEARNKAPAVPNNDVPRASTVGNVRPPPAVPQPLAGNPPPQTTPRIVPPATPAVRPPTLQQSNAPSTSSTPSAPVVKRPAGDDADGVPKKRKVTTCMICDQRPGHLVHDCPNIRSIDGLRSAVAKLEAMGEAGDTRILSVLQRMLAKRTAPK